MKRRRLLAGLSAASVASLLPRQVLADDALKFRRVWVTNPVEVGEAIRFTVRAVAGSEMRFRSGSFRVSGTLGWEHGAALDFDEAQIESERGSSRFERMSRAGPRAITLTLEPGDRAVLGYFHVETREGSLPTTGEFRVRFTERHAVSATLV